MKTIYTQLQVELLEGDVNVATFPTFRELSVNEDNMNHYADSVIPMDPEDVAKVEESLKKEMIARLWDSCNEYQYNRIASLGAVNLGRKEPPNTKAMANLMWINQLWGEYKRKRDLITSTRIGTPLMETRTVMKYINGPDNPPVETEVVVDLYDFSYMGDLPYSYFEAMDEHD